MDRQLEQARSLVYEALAELLPVPGRDYTVDVTVQNDAVSVHIHSLTPLGRLFIAHCQTHLAPKLKELKDGSNKA